MSGWQSFSRRRDRTSTAQAARSALVRRDLEAGGDGDGEGGRMRCGQDRGGGAEEKTVRVRGRGRVRESGHLTGGVVSCRVVLGGRISDSV